MGGRCSKPKDGDIHFDFGDGQQWTYSQEDSESSTPTDLAPRAVLPRSPPRENKSPLLKPRVPLPAPVHKSPPKPSETFQPPVQNTVFVPKQAAAIATVIKAAPPSAPKPPQHLNDDDFSVAPSLHLECRSIGKTKFDDIYTRGRKVSPRKKERERCSEYSIRF
jgi:hypothetical protein